MRCKFLLSLLVLSCTAHAGSYTERAVTQAVAGGTLYGTELIPEGGAKVPVVLLHSGSGPTDRDGNSEAASLLNNSLRMLAESLAQQGIATVRYDKRGVASSAGWSRRNPICASIVMSMTPWCGCANCARTSASRAW